MLQHKLDRKTLGMRRPTLKGQATIEMLVVLLMLVPLIFGAFELARGVAIHSALDSGTNIAVRALSLDPTQLIFAHDAVDNAVSTNIMGDSGVGTPTITPVSPSNPNGPAIALSNVHFGEAFCIRSRVDFTPSIPFLAPQTIPMQVVHCAVMERMQ
jgi:hypothetical protein